MITEQHHKFIEERNIVITKALSGYFVYKKNFARLGRYFSCWEDNINIQNIHHIVDGVDCSLKDVHVKYLPYILSYISDYSTNLLYYKYEDSLRLCQRTDDYKNAILIRQSDNILRDGFLRGIDLIPDAPLNINITNAKIIRNPRVENFVVLDNTEKPLCVSSKDITEIMARETCLEALEIAYDLLKRLKIDNLEKIPIPANILKRLKNERPNYYEEIKLKNK